MYQSYVGSIDTDAGIGTILSRFESQYIIDVVNDSLTMRFRPFNTPMPNMPDVLERRFQMVYKAAPDYREKIDDCRTETYKEIIENQIGRANSSLFTYEASKSILEISANERYTNTEDNKHKSCCC